jgi:hypothetical protein
MIATANGLPDSERNETAKPCGFVVLSGRSGFPTIYELGRASPPGQSKPIMLRVEQQNRPIIALV